MTLRAGAPNRAALTFCVMLATLMQSLDNTIANVALPYMQGSMAASQDQINWVLTSYIVAAAIMTAPTGFLADRFGRTRVFVGAVSGFMIASVLCGLAQSVHQIVVFRLLQGMFGAALVPLSQSVMFDIYPIEQRGQAMALWGMGVMVGPVIGPSLGGWLTASYSWRWVFYINLPIGLCTLIGLLSFLPDTPHGKTKFDWTGFCLLGLGLGALQTMLDRGEQMDWFSSREIVLEAGVAVTGLYCFVVHFLLAENPVISPKLFRDVNFIVGTFCAAMMSMTLMATLALLTPFLQTLMNYPVLTAGLVLAPRGLGTIVSMYLAGHLLKYVSARNLTITGFGFMIYALHDLMHFTVDVSSWSIMRTGFIQGASVGLIFIPLSTVSFATLPKHLRTQGTAVYSLLRNVAGAVGISMTGSLLLRNNQVNHAAIAALVTPFNQALQAGAAARFWNPSAPHGAAALDAEINRQASTIAYIDDYKLMLIVAVISIPLLFLIRPPRLMPAPDPHAFMD